MRILAVDDEQSALHLLESAITEAAPDAELQSFQNPNEAWESAKDNPYDVAFLDIEMGGMNGIELGKLLKSVHPQTNLIFVTGYLSYAASTYSLRASGYLQKPITAEAVSLELQNLRYPMPKPEKNTKIEVRCFGTFEVFCKGVPIHFERNMTKELLAILIDRKGARVSTGEICAKLWEEQNLSVQQEKNHLRQLVNDLTKNLRAHDAEDVLLRWRDFYAIQPEKIDCDYYDYLGGIPYAIRAYQGEYMEQYSWGEVTNATLYFQTLKQNPHFGEE